MKTGLRLSDEPFVTQVVRRWYSRRPHGREAFVIAMLWLYRRAVDDRLELKQENRRLRTELQARDSNPDLPANNRTSYR